MQHLIWTPPCRQAQRAAIINPETVTNRRGENQSWIPTFRDERCGTDQKALCPDYSRCTTTSRFS